MLKDQRIPVTDSRTRRENDFLRPKLIELNESEIDRATKRQALKAKKSRKEMVLNL